MFGRKIFDSNKLPQVYGQEDLLIGQDYVVINAVNNTSELEHIFPEYLPIQLL